MGRMMRPALALLLGLLQLVLNLFHTSEAVIKGSEFVTCGSVIKLLNDGQKARLHSHDVKYGSGSGQQSVTGMPDMDDHNSHWALEGKLDATCTRGEPIDCGSIVRFHHAVTGCHLHSHHFPSPLSRNQEVSCFGSAEKDSDTGDHWEVICNGDSWKRKENVQFKHVDTGML